MCKVNEKSKYRWEKSEVLSDKKLKEVTESELSKAEKDIENEWKEIKKNEVDKEKEDQEGNFFVKIWKGFSKEKKKKKIIRNPYRIEIEKRKYGIDIYHEWDKEEGAISFYDLDLIEYYNPKETKLIYGAHIIATISIILLMVLSTIIIACLMRDFYSGKLQILTFFKLGDVIVSFQSKKFIEVIILLSVYLCIGYGVIIDKRKNDISWRVKNKETNTLSKIRLSLLMDMNFNSAITFAYFLIYFVILIRLYYIYIYIRIYINSDVLLHHSFKTFIALAFPILILIGYIYVCILMILVLAYMGKSLAIFISLFLISVLSLNNESIVNFLVVFFALIEFLPSEDFWLVMAKQIPLKYIEDSTEKIKRLVKRNIYIFKVQRLLTYLSVLTAIYMSEKFNLLFLFGKSEKLNLLSLVVKIEKLNYFFSVVEEASYDNIYGIYNILLTAFNKLLWITILVLLTWRLMKKAEVKIFTDPVKHRLYDMIYKDVYDYVLVTPSIKEKVRLSISYANKIDPKSLVENMADLPDETKVFIERIDEINKKCRVIVIMPDLTVHSGIVEFEPEIET